MPAARTTASAMVERETRGCISILTTRHDLKTPDHDRLARSREHSCRQLGMRLRSASRLGKFICSSTSVAWAHLDHSPDTERAARREARFLLYRCTSNRSVMFVAQEHAWRSASRV